MINKIPLEKWSTAAAGAGQGVNSLHALWLLRLTVFGLAALASLFALAGFANMAIDAFSPEQGLARSSALSASDEPVSAISPALVKSWGWYSVPVSQTELRPVANSQLQKTRLKLILEGIVRNSDETNSVVIITAGNKTEHFKIGDKLPGGARVYLREVRTHSVILENGGKLEELQLYEFSLENNKKLKAVSAPKASSGHGPGLDKRSDSQATQILNEYRTALQSNPSSLTDVMSFSMATGANGAQGIRIRPKGDNSHFEQLGLADGDVITHINGIDISDLSKAQDIYKQLGDMTELEINFKRNGAEQQVIYNLQ